MRIIGGHDYYDSALAFGQDDNVVYVRYKDKFIKPVDAPVMGVSYGGDYVADLRLPTTLYDRHNKDIKKNYYGHYHPEFVVDDKRYAVKFNLIVLLAGKRYNGVCLECMSHPSSIKNSYFWNYEDLENFLNKVGYHFSEDKPKRSRWSRNKGYFSGAEYANRYFRKEISQIEYNWMVEKRITNVIYEAYNTYRQPNKDLIVDSDRLKEFEFFKKVDAYTAFQEISMWVGGILPKDGNPMVEIMDDKVKLAKHGMDKWSFRKPGKKGMG